MNAQEKALNLEIAIWVGTPSEDHKIEREEAGLEALDCLRAREHRQLAARANFMTLQTGMAHLTVGDKREEVWSVFPWTSTSCLAVQAPDPGSSFRQVIRF